MGIFVADYLHLTGFPRREQEFGLLNDISVLFPAPATHITLRECLGRVSRARGAKPPPAAIRIRQESSEGLLDVFLVFLHQFVHAAPERSSETGNVDPAQKYEKE